MLSTTEPHKRTLKEDVREGSKSRFWIRTIYLNIFMKHPTCAETGEDPHTGCRPAPAKKNVNLCFVQ